MHTLKKQVRERQRENTNTSAHGSKESSRKEITSNPVESKANAAYDAEYLEKAKAEFLSSRTSLNKKTQKPLKFKDLS